MCWLKWTPRLEFPEPLTIFLWPHGSPFRQMQCSSNGWPPEALKVIKNPVWDHFPVGCLKIGTSLSIPAVSNVQELVPSSNPIASVVVGGLGPWQAQVEYTEKTVSISNCPFLRPSPAQTLPQPLKKYGESFDSRTLLWNTETGDTASPDSSNSLLEDDLPAPRLWG